MKPAKMFNRKTAEPTKILEPKKFDYRKYVMATIKTTAITFLFAYAAYDLYTFGKNFVDNYETIVWVMENPEISKTKMIEHKVMIGTVNENFVSPIPVATESAKKASSLGR